MSNIIRERILGALRDIEQEHGVHIIYACESGSRAWGMASENSDYDVRFLYVRPKAAYLQLDMPRDVIEIPIVDELDISGWDIFKALRLLRKSNPPLLEWLHSPIIYIEDSAYVERMRVFVREHFSAPALSYHYSRMAYRNYHQYIENKAEVSLKKYLYVLRPIISHLFLEQERVVPFTDFTDSLARIEIEPEVRTRILELLDLKQSGAELGAGAGDAVLNAFIDDQLGRWNKTTLTPDTTHTAQQALDMLLAGILDEQEARLPGMTPGHEATV